MNSHDEKQLVAAQAELEAAIDCRLKALPELRAPATLLPRVLAVIERRAVPAWYCRSWQMWPAALRAVSLAVLLAAFGGLCFAGWELSHAAGVGEATQTLRQWVSGLGAMWNTLAVILQAMLLAVKHLGPLFIAVCVFGGIAAYLSCLGLGTAFVRLAVARRQNGI